MRRSEIFESFVKIAQDKGLVSKDAPEKAIKQLSKTHRHDSLSADDIAKLYGVKPNLPKGMEYDRNIIEDAHPDSIVVAPAHDKLNGLVENNNERQDILLNIVNKNNNGQLDNHKWAENKLLLNLVRLGNDLDNRNQENLRLLSDACLSQVGQPLKKEAWVLPAAAGVALVLGALYAQQHLPDANEGLQRNSENLIEKIDKLVNSSSTWGVGVKYKPEFIQEMEGFKTKVNELTHIAESADQTIARLVKPREAKELLELSKAPETTDVSSAYQALRSKIAQLTPYFRSILSNFANQSYKDRQIEEKGTLTGLIDKTQVLHGGYGLISDDFDNVRLALAPYKQSYIDIVKVLREMGSLIKKAKADLEGSAKEFSTEVDAAPAPGAKVSPEEAHKAELAKLEQEASGFLPKIK